MAKTRKQPEKIMQTCADCVHEFACKIWTCGRELSPENAAVCPQFKRMKDTASYLIGKMEGAESAIKHGKWVDKYNDCSCAECTVCGEFYETADQDCVTADSFRLFVRFYKYCPNCGAKMDFQDGCEREVR